MDTKNKAKNSLYNTVLLAVCSFVGAGFISGAEIWFYFARFGWALPFGLCTFAVLCFLLCYFCQTSKSSFSPREYQFKQTVTFASEILVASAMISGLREVSKTLFPNFWFLAFCIAIVFILLLLLRGKTSFVYFNFFVAIFIIFVIVSLFLFDNHMQASFDASFSLKNIFSSVVFAFIYIFMNIAEIKSILSENAEKRTKKQKLILSLVLSLILIFLIFTLSLELSKFGAVKEESMPFLLVFKAQGNAFLIIFSCGLLACMVSTAEACLMAAKSKLKFQKNDSKFACILVMLISLNLAVFSFDFFVKIVYPILAVLNFFVFVLEFKTWLGNRK